VLTTTAQPVINMGILDNFESSLFPEEAGNGEIIQPEIPFEYIDRLSLEQIERYQERLAYMEEHGI
jgi:hypothetical protein